MNTDDHRVIELRSIQGRKDRPPPLSDAELVQLRQMLADFQLVAAECPMARRILDPRD